MTAEKIIESLKFTATEADEQKDLFTPSHVLYKCRIINPANNRRYMSAIIGMIRKLRKSKTLSFLPD